MFARSDRDGYEDRVDEHRHRFLKQVLDDVVQRAEADGIDRLLLSAPPKLRDEVRALVGEHDTLRVLVADQAWESTPAREVATHAWELLRSVHGDREAALVTSATERALAGGAGALGLRAVCEALNAGRVEHLLYDDGLTVEGFVSSQGTLHPRIEGAVAESDLTFSRDPLFVERLLEAALATSASVTPLNESAAAALAEHDGVAALLRW
jgi:peptide subunit release factor 1 (eRF1)